MLTATSEDFNKAPFTHQSGINYEGFLFWPREASSSSEFIRLLFFTSDGMLTLTVLSMLFLITYRLLGSPLDGHLEDKRLERNKLWNAHFQRFKTKSSDNCVGSGNYGGEKNSTEARDLVEKRSKYVDCITVDTLTVSLAEKGDDEEQNTRVTIVGDRSKATLSVVTHHDVCTTSRHGLLPFSVEVLVELMCHQETHKHNKKGNVVGTCSSLNDGDFSSLCRERVCFYHISAPGHVEDETDDVTHELSGERGWNMDSLAGRMNKVVARLGIAGRCVYLGEGAGANICLRAACKQVQRARCQYNTNGIMLSGVVFICGECSAPTVGDNITSMFGSALIRGGYGLSSTMGYFGTVPNTMWMDKRYISTMSRLNPKNVGDFAQAFYTTGMRTRIRNQQTRLLKNIPNLVLCPEKSNAAIEKAKELNELLDQTSRGSGAVAVKSSGPIGSRYVAGGGVLLNDRLGRSQCVEAFKLFIEGCL